MSKAEKLAAKILSGRSDQNFAFDDFATLSSGLVFSGERGKEVIGSITRMALVRLSMSSRATGKRNHIR
jgi:hypothetical protein